MTLVNLSTSWEQAVRTHPDDKLLVQHCYKSAAGLLQLVCFYIRVWAWFKSVSGGKYAGKWLSANVTSLSSGMLVAKIGAKMCPKPSLCRKNPMVNFNWRVCKWLEPRACSYELAWLAMLFLYVFEIWFTWGPLERGDISPSRAQMNALTHVSKNTQVVTNLQQTCSNVVPTTCQQDVFALLVPSLLTTCQRLVDNLLQSCWAQQTCYKLFQQN